METEEAGHGGSSLEQAIGQYLATVDVHKTACMQAWMSMQQPCDYAEFEEVFRACMRKRMEQCVEPGYAKWDSFGFTTGSEETGKAE